MKQLELFETNETQGQNVKASEEMVLYDPRDGNFYIEPIDKFAPINPALLIRQRHMKNFDGHLRTANRIDAQYAQMADMCENKLWQEDEENVFTGY